jgi:hypothetical protein
MPLDGNRPGAVKGQIELTYKESSDRPYVAAFMDREGVILWIGSGLTPEHAIDAARFKAEADVRLRQEVLASIVSGMTESPGEERPTPDAALLQ